jgi:hypothetical protein
MMKTTTLLLLLALPVAVAGQRARIVFDSRSHHLGKIEASKGAVSHAFTFTNKGDIPLFILDAESACGCTVPGWSEHPVLPGQTGSITVNLDPHGLSGTFNKRITVYSSGNVATQLKITGEVVVDPVDVERLYPFAIGSLRLSTDTIQLNASKLSRVIQLLNAGKRKISITSVTKPDEVMVDYTPPVLPPGARGNIVFIYTPAAGHEKGKLARVLVRTSEGVTGTINVKL